MTQELSSFSLECALHSQIQVEGYQGASKVQGGLSSVSDCARLHCPPF